MKKVLIADDSVYHRTLLSAILKKKNIELDMASDGDEAVEKFKTFSPDLVFLDIMMPKSNGFEALKKMKEIKPDIVCIILSVLSSSDDVHKAKDSGADGYLLKPFESEKINGVLKKFKIIE